MPRGKIDLKKIQASLTTTCPKCGRVIQPSEIRRVNFEEMICPECGARFDAAETRRGKPRSSSYGAIPYGNGKSRK